VRPAVAGTWFHHLREDRWLSAGETVFVRVEQSPMGYGLGAVPADEVGSGEQRGVLDVEQARSAVLAGVR
jgi:hypothetical protein